MVLGAQVAPEPDQGTVESGRHGVSVAAFADRGALK
jgi:hypothetical protein